MSVTLGFALALAASLGFALLDGIRKHIVQSLSPLAAATLINGGQAVILLSASGGVPDVPPAFYAVVAATVLINTTTTLLYLEAVRSSPLSLTVPYLALTPALLLVTAAVVLDERPSLRGALGVVLVAAGAYVLPGLASWRAPVAALRRERGSRLMLVVAGLWAVSAALDKLAVGWASPTYYGGVVFGTSSALMLVYLVLRRPHAWAGTRRVAPWVVLAVLGSAGALWAQYASYAALPVSYTIAIKRAGMLASVVIGRLWFGEAELGTRLLGAGTMVAGVVLIVTST